MNNIERKIELQKINPSSDMAKRMVRVLNIDKSESIIHNMRQDWMYDRLKIKKPK